MNLEPPFDTFTIEKHAGEHKDFDPSPDSPYPLRGVTYPVDYGDIKGYVAEDGANLDLFVGKNGTLAGFLKVFRPELPNGEHKFYINLTEDEEESVLKEFGPVILTSGRFESNKELIKAIEPFREKH